MGTWHPNDHTLILLNLFGTECSSKSHNRVLSEEDMVQVQGCAKRKEKSILSECLPSFYRKEFARAVLQKSILFPPGLYAYHSDGPYWASHKTFQQVLPWYTCTLLLPSGNLCSYSQPCPQTHWCQSLCNYIKYSNNTPVHEQSTHTQKRVVVSCVYKNEAECFGKTH